ncbi:MAG: hypothetical protein CML17_12240 [Pusillimonas sp.]|jgi:hypothetical protein|nr:hypothetical protein [Pusillimonas sp.]
MAEKNLTDFSLSRDSYTAFDAKSLKELIQTRLNEGGIYTDQSFEGSNMSSIIDVIAYSYHLLLFYLNQTSSDSMFTDTSLYENMNRIVKLIDYKPKGYQTSLLSFDLKASSLLPVDTYTIKRYSYFIAGGVYYSFINDSTFNKTVPGDQTLGNFSSENILREGQYFEYPEVIALGEDFETIPLAVKSNDDNVNINIDSNSIGVYVQDNNTKKIVEFNETSSLFLENSESTSYEKRLNENGLYEFKFGNGIFGKKLNAGDSVLIYYIQSSGEAGIISPGVLDGNNLNLYITPRFDNIGRNIYNNTFNFITPQQIQYLAFSNTLQSTNPVDIEDVESIRANASKNFQLQNRVITISDYNNFLQSNFSQVLKSFSVVNNDSYVDNYLNYFLNIGLNKPNDDSRVLFNQVNFNSINQANNIYLFLVSKFNNVDRNDNLNFVSTSQKSSIINAFKEKQQANINIVPVDPVYTAFSLGVRTGENEILTKDISDESFLVISRNVLSNSSTESIKQRVNNIFINYFESLNLNDLVSLKEISNQIFNIEGVEKITSRRINNSVTINEVDGISLLVYNPIYPNNDIQIIGNDLKLPFFKYPFLSKKTILSNIIIEDA